MNGAIDLRISAVSYSLFMSFFPFIIFLFSLIQYSSIYDDLRSVFNQDVLPNLFSDSSVYITYSLDQIIGKKDLTGISLGLFLAVVFSTNGINALISGFNRTYHNIETRTVVRQYIMAFFLTIILTTLFIVELFMIYYLSPVHEYLSKQYYFIFRLEDYSKLISETLVFVFTGAMFFVAIFLLYKMGAKTRFKRKEVLVGTVFSTICFMMMFWLFSYYIRHYANYKNLYHSLGTVIIVLVWIYINVGIIIVGFELMAAIYTVSNQSKKLMK